MIVRIDCKGVPSAEAHETFSPQSLMRRLSGELAFARAGNGR